MRYYLDTEFLERPCTIELISLALVAEDGQELYCVSSDFEWDGVELTNQFVWNNVRPNLGHPDGQMVPKIRRTEIAKQVRAFLGADDPEIWGYFADYDWVVFCWLFGPMVSLPKGFPYFCLDLKQTMVERGVKRDAVTAAIGAPDVEHNALSDARWNRKLHDYLRSLR